MNYKLLRYFSAAILVLGAFKMPYGYYRFLRVTTFIVAAILLYLGYTRKSELWMVLFGLLFIIFNPIYPMTFDKTTWAVIDVLSAGLVLLSIKYLK